LWAEIEQIRPEIQKMRDDLAALRAPVTDEATDGDTDEAAGADAGATEGGDGEEAAADGEAAAAPMTEEERQAKIAELEAKIADASEDFYGKIVEFINKSGIVEGEEMTTEQKRAFEWKANEDIAISQEYIDKGGDYSRAIDILSNALMNDSDNAALQAAKADAERLQYMDEERFSQVKKGMTRDEVLAILGNTHHNNKREYEDGTLGWFYKKDGGGAAGVFFREKRGEFVVATMDFNAAKAAGDE
jgi:hypothetical protein